MPDHPDPAQLVTPDPDDDGTPQASSKRFPWSKPKVQTKPTGKDRRQMRRAAKQAPLP